MGAKTSKMYLKCVLAYPKEVGCYVTQMVSCQKGNEPTTTCIAEGPHAFSSFLICYIWNKIRIIRLSTACVLALIKTYNMPIDIGIEKFGIAGYKC